MKTSAMSDLLGLLLWVDTAYSTSYALLIDFWDLMLQLHQVVQLDMAMPLKIYFNIIDLLFRWF